MKLHERAICMAVFCLSPVSIQKFIPAFLKVSIVSGTPSWKFKYQQNDQFKNAKTTRKKYSTLSRSSFHNQQSLKIWANPHVRGIIFQSSMVTFTCRRSSMAVTPRTSKSCSNLWQTSASLHCKKKLLN